MTAGSSGTGSTTSEMARVTARPPAAAASRPPLIADRCLRTQLRPSIATPERSRTEVAADLSSSVSPAAGAARPAEAPPDSSRTRTSSGFRPAASASARRPAATLPAVGAGCPTSNHCRSPAGAPGCGEAISPRSPRAPAPGTAETNADAISAAALPAAATTGARPPRSRSTAPPRNARPTSSAAPAADMPPRTISRAWRRRVSRVRSGPVSASVAGPRRRTTGSRRRSDAADG